MPARKPARKAGSRSEIKLEVDCTLSQAAGLKSRLVSMVSRTGNVAIDASATQRIDAPSLQLLAAFVRDRAAKGRTVSWQSAAPVIEESAQRIGLHSLLQFTPAKTAGR